MAIKLEKYKRKMELNAKINVIFWHYSHKVDDRC